MPYELHPEIGPGGIPTSRRFSAVAPLAEGEGLVFHPPSRFRPTRGCHQVALLAAHLDAEAAESVHDRLFAAYWDRELDVEDPEVLVDIMTVSSVDPDLVRETVTTGALLPAVGTSMMRAAEWGVGGTPAHVVANALHVPGLQEDEFWDRVVTRIGARSATPDAPGENPEPGRPE